MSKFKIQLVETEEWGKNGVREKTEIANLGSKREEGGGGIINSQGRI